MVVPKDRKLFGRLVRLAYTKPSMRSSLLPLLLEEKSQRRVASALLQSFLGKMAKGVKGGVSIPLLQEAFDLMPGWSLEETSVTLNLNGPSAGLLWLLLPQWKAEAERAGARAFLPALNKKDSFEVLFKSGSDLSEIEQVLQNMKKYAKIVRTAPTSGVLGEVYVTAPGAPERRFGAEFSVKIDKAWTVVLGWTFTAPNGSSILLPSPLKRDGSPENPTNLKLTSFWTWGYKNGLKESAEAALASMGQSPQEAPGSGTQREEIRRERSEEVRKILNQLVDKKYNEVVKSLTDSANQVLQQFLDEQDATDKASFSESVFFRKNKAELFYRAAVLSAVERPDWLQGYKLKTAWKQELSKWATSMADAAKSAFVDKNDEKLTLIVKGKGNLKGARILSLNPSAFDYGGDILFEFEDGSSFVVRNKSVFKVSSMGTPFLQFPTTFHKVVLPDGSKMPGVSEKKMLEVFTGQ